MEKEMDFKLWKKVYLVFVFEKGLDLFELLLSEVDGFNIMDIIVWFDCLVGELFRMLVVLE